MTAPAGIFDEASLAELRALVAPTRTATCAVRRPVTVIGTGGVQQQAWDVVPALAALPCSLKPAGAPSEAITADAVRAATRFVVGFDPEAFGAVGPVPAPGAAGRATYAAVLPTDRLTLTHTLPGLPSPLVLSVLGDQPKGADEVSRKVLAERIAAGGV